MSRRALLLATRDQLRTGLGLPTTKPLLCEVMFDGEPPPGCGKTFYSVHRGPRDNSCRHSLDETYAANVTITMRVNEPYDRIGTDLMEKAATGMDLQADKVRSLIHMNYTLMNAANAYILSDYVAAGGAGVIYGFSEPLYFQGDGEPRIVGPDWFKADVTESTQAPIGIAQTLRFGGARRLQPNSVYYFDSFTGTDGTSLANHVMDMGTGWTQQALTGTLATLSSGRVLFNENGRLLVKGIVWTTTTDYSSGTFNVTVNFPVASNPFSAAGLVIRFQDMDNYTAILVSRALNALVILEVNAGISTVRQSTSVGTVSTGVDYTIRAVVNGISVTATVNGGSVASYGSLAVNTAGTIHGLRLDSQAVTDQCLFDNFGINQ